ncbi:class F sortase [Streptomyces barringtoniae]|uniref:class F sortase n=1 Tax=Streptomyces barringtoniae TaxID=2892029 RepID=UPI001E62CA4D|nr:class F sortase [Streptomyces barringtoniae]MCC5475024.1 class F sortase [Streptomyces barringtoniae]
MAPRRRKRRPWYRTRAYRLTRTALLVTVLVTVGSRCGGGHAGTGRPGDPDAVAAAGGPGGSGERSCEPPAGPPPGPLPRSRPTSFRVPSLGIDAPITAIGLDRERQLEAPPVDEPKLVGWYEGGPTPGESGTAIAVGHRDTRTGPAVFAALAQVKPCRLIEVRRADGRTAVYAVDRMKVYDKAGFPDKEVYAQTGRPELRVLTCGGFYTRRSGYTSNAVVFAHLIATK